MKLNIGFVISTLAICISIATLIVGCSSDTINLSVEEAKGYESEEKISLEKGNVYKVLDVRESTSSARRVLILVLLDGENRIYASFETYSSDIVDEYINMAKLVKVMNLNIWEIMNMK